MRLPALVCGAEFSAMYYLQKTIFRNKTGPKKVNNDLFSHVDLCNAGLIIIILEPAGCL
jgi:hypothetical protein